MPYLPLTLDLDITGLNVNNKIINEPHTLSGNKYRSIASNYGPFFAESLIVTNGVNTLVRGTDYQIVELHQEATSLYGKEISTVILIINLAVTNSVNITYQALGGLYAFNDKAVADMYNTVIQDNRPITWTSVLNKPVEFSPTIHRHLLDDVYGFEPIVDVLERIRRAITIGQVNIVGDIINSFLLDYDPTKIDKILPINKYMTIDHFMHFMSQHKFFSQISVVGINSIFYQGNTLNIEVDNSLLPNPTNIYWELYTPTGIVNSFKVLKGSIHTNNTTSIVIYIPTGVINNVLYLGARLINNNLDFDAVTYRLPIQQA